MKVTVSLGVVAIAAGLFAASCSHAPRLERNSEEVAGFRAHYLEYHPHDPFKKQILKSEVHKDMSYMQVLASWGLPNLRSGNAEEGSEVWAYYAVDEHSKELRNYQLAFYRNRLIIWQITNDPGIGLVHPDDLTGLPVVDSSSMTMSSGLGSLGSKP